MIKKIVSMSNIHFHQEDQGVYTVSNNRLIRTMSVVSLINTFIGSLMPQRDDVVSINGNDPSQSPFLAIVNSGILCLQGGMIVVFTAKSYSLFRTKERGCMES